jgi:predicted nucleic acid-binding protein
MIIVSDTTPFRYLIEVDTVEILATLFGQVIIPEAVAGELQHQKTPPKIKSWMQSPPAWLEIKKADITLFTPVEIIGPGETEAIALALELKADAILIDENAGKDEAARVGLLVLRTLTILETAAIQELIDLPAVIARLKQTTFRVAPKLYQDLLDRDALRKQAQQSGS